MTWDTTGKFSMARKKASATRPLRNLSTKQLSALAREMVADSGLPVGSSGWQSAIDQNLRSESLLAAPELRRRADALSPRWADVYLNELRQKLVGLDNDRRQYLELNARLTAYLLEQYELDEAEKIQDDEIAAGWYDFPYRIAAKELAAQQEWADATKETIPFYDDVLRHTEFNWVLESFETAINQRAWLAQIGLYSAYLPVHNQYAQSNAASNYLHARDPFLNKGPPKIAQPPAAGTISDAKPLHGWVYQLTRTAAAPEIVSYQIGFKTQNRLTRGSAVSSALLVDAKSVATDWSQKDIEFRRRRAELTRTSNALKRKALTDPDGPLNLLPHLFGMRARFVDQLADALSMSEVIVQGFATYWAWDTGGAPPAPSTWNDKAGSFLDALMEWQRQTERAVVARLHRESAGVITLSLRGLVGESAWNKAVTAAVGGKPFVLSFQVLAAQFEPYKGVRFRGLSAYVSGVTDETAGIWHGSVKLPEKVVVVDGNGAPASLRQPPLGADLGRVLTRANHKPADVVGSAQLRNLSPISDAPVSALSQYELTMASLSSGGTAIAALKDVSIDILFSYFQ